MKKAFFLLASLGTALGNVGAAHADVAWEHRGTVTLGGSPPLAYFAMKNEWSGQKHRTHMTFDATKIAGEFSLGGAPKARAQVQVIERLDDDRLILSTDQEKTYIDEPYKSLKGRLRLNAWELFGSDLSATDIPELTPEQRARLGQELRAVTAPFTRKIVRYYFRPLPQTRTIQGMTSRGYRFTMMINGSMEKKNPEWLKMNAEWWIADGVAGDEEIRAFTREAMQIRKEGGGPSASMWINEYFPVLWESMPVEMHQAMDSMVGKKESPNFGFQGTPMQLFFTVTPPPTETLGMGGDIRFSLVLSKRDTSPVEATLFDPPADGEKIAIEPFLGMARNAIKMGRSEFEKMLDQ